MLIMLCPKSGTRAYGKGIRNKGQLGFTLLELLVVLVIIAIISTTSIGALRFFEEQTTKSFQEKIKHLLILGIDEAVLTGKVHGLFRVNNKLMLRRFARPKVDIKPPPNSTAKTVGSVLTNLIEFADIGDKKDTEGSKSVSKSVTDDPGTFAEDSLGVWVDLKIEPVVIPEAFEVTFTTNEAITLKDFLDTKEDASVRDSEANISNNQEGRREGKRGEKNKQTKLITTFWPGGLVQPAGTVTITGKDHVKVGIRWLPSAEIELTGNEL